MRYAARDRAIADVVDGALIATITKVASSAFELESAIGRRLAPGRQPPP
jgi:hypothetical protein